MSLRQALFALLGVCTLSAPGFADEPPSAPDFTRVDHARPEAALALCPEFGSEAEIATIGAVCKGRTLVETVRAVDTWVQRHFRYDEQAAYAWRDFARMREEGTYGGCADHAVLFGSLLRAAGVPTVFVKSMDAAWIRAFVQGPEPTRWSGHCFLEVFDGARWALLDASGLNLYRDYKPAMRILPGTKPGTAHVRYAYDKSLNPYTMVKSMRWELWKKQTRAYFTDFDLARLPVGEGEALRPSSSGAPLRTTLPAPGERISVVGNSMTKAMVARLQHLGAQPNYTYSQNFERWFAAGRGGWLFVLAPAKRPALPEALLEQGLGASFADLQASLKQHGSGVFARKNPRGTRIFVLWASDEAALQRLIDTVEFVEPSPTRA